MSNLLPCPFCGANPHTGLSKTKEHVNSGGKYQYFVIKCPKNHAIVSNTKEFAIKEWNSRAALPVEIALPEQLPNIYDF